MSNQDECTHRGPADLVSVYETAEDSGYYTITVRCKGCGREFVAEGCYYSSFISNSSSDALEMGEPIIETVTIKALPIHTFYLTFGSGQLHEGKYVIIRSHDKDVARKRAFEMFDRKWSRLYEEHEWTRDGKTQAEDYGLTELKVC